MRKGLRWLPDSSSTNVSTLLLGEAHGVGSYFRKINLSSPHWTADLQSPWPQGRDDTVETWSWFWNWTFKVGGKKCKTRMVGLEECMVG